MPKRFISSRPKRSARRPSRQSAISPPPLTPSLMGRYRARYVVTADFSSTLGYSSLCRNFCICSSVANPERVSCFFSNVKILSIEAWCQNPGSGSFAVGAATIALNWTGADSLGLGLDKVVSDTALGTARPAHIYSRPPRQAPASMWHPYTSTDAYASMTVPQGTIIDVFFAFVVDASPQSIPADLVTTSTGLTIGVQYASSLDGASAIAPVGRTNIIK